MNPKEIANKGRAIYNTKLKRKLERKDKGKFVVIDIDTEEYFVDDRSEEALTKAKKARPKDTFYLHRIGYPAAFNLESLL